jgi:hypothetical protein
VYGVCDQSWWTSKRCVVDPVSSSMLLEIVLPAGPLLRGALWELTVLDWAPLARVLSNGATGTDDLLLITAVSVVFTVAGLLAIDANYGVFREWFQVKSTPTTTVDAAPVGEVHIEGKLRPASQDGPVESPSGRPCSYLYCEHDETNEQPAQMVITDETGSMLVDTPVEPDIRDLNPTVSITETTHATGLGVGEDHTEYTIGCTDGDVYRARVKLDEEHVTPLAGTVSDGLVDTASDRDSREYVIPYDRTVYVSGQATRDERAERAGTTSDLAVVAADHTDGLLVADRPEDELTWLLAKEWLVYFLLGISLVILGGLSLLGVLVQYGAVPFVAVLAVILGLVGLLVRVGLLG